MSNSEEYFFIIASRLDYTEEGEVSGWEELFRTEVRGFHYEEEQKLRQWRREWELEYFPEHTLLADGIYWDVIELKDGVRIEFVLRCG